MENKKSYIILFIILIAYLAIALIISKTGLLDKKISYIVFSDQSYLSIENKKYSFAEDKLDAISKIYAKKKFEIYDYNKYLGKYNIKSTNGEYKIYDDDYNLIRFEQDPIAIFSIKNQIKVNTNKIEQLNSADQNYLKKILADQNIKFPSNLAISEKIKINLNNEDVYLYNVSSVDYFSNDDDYFSALYIINQDTYKLIKFEKYDSEDIFDSETFYIELIADINRDHNDELIIDTMISSQNGNPTRTVYEYKDHEYRQTAIKELDINNN